MPTWVVLAHPPLVSFCPWSACKSLSPCNSLSPCIPFWFTNLMIIVWKSLQDHNSKRANHILKSNEVLMFYHPSIKPGSHCLAADLSCLYCHVRGPCQPGCQLSPNQVSDCDVCRTARGRNLQGIAAKQYHRSPLASESAFSFHWVWHQELSWELHPMEDFLWALQGRSPSCV